MSGPAAHMPEGGVAPVSRRVMNLAHFLVQAARRHPERHALICGEATLSWRELDGRSAALARALAAHGVGKGDRVLVHSRNSFEFVETLFATLRLGAVWVPTNFRIAPDEAAYLAQASGAKVFLCQGDYADHAEAVARAMPQLALLARLGPEGFAAPEVADLIEAQRGAAPACVDVEHDDPCWFFFTSGTTGRPKAAVLTHGQMAFVITNHLCDLMPGDRAGRQPGRGAAVARRRHPSADPGGARRLHRAAGVHALRRRGDLAAGGAPSGEQHVHRAHHRQDAGRTSGRRRLGSLQPALRDLCRRAHVPRRPEARAGKLGPVLVQYFGLGEVTGNITVLPPALHEAADAPGARLGTCGIERTGMQVSIQDDSGRQLDPGQPGEICVCGPAVFAGYYANPQANEKAFRDGWFRTGDLGYMDAEGFVYITGRQSDMYISGGSNIYPREVEERC